MAEQRQEQEMGGILFFEKTKKSEKAPDWRGRCCVNGQQLELAAWERKASNGNTFLSLRFQLPREQRQDDGGQAAPTRRAPGRTASPPLPTGEEPLPF